MAIHCIVCGKVSLTTTTTTTIVIQLMNNAVENRFADKWLVKYSTATLTCICSII